MTVYGQFHRGQPSPVRKLVVPAALPRKRVLSLMLLMALVAGALVFRLGSLQITPPARYLKLAEDQSTKFVKLTAGRGDIVDRNGQEFAISAPSQTIVVDPTLMTDINDAVNKLAPVFNLDPVALQTRLLDAQRKNRHFEYIARQVDDDQAAFAKAFDIPGLFTINEPKRDYPGGQKLAASVLGDTNVDGEGMSGLERQYDAVLTGRAGHEVVRQGPDGRTIVGGAVEDVPAVSGSTVVLTLDRALQLETEAILERNIDKADAHYGIAIVSEIGTSRILANAVVGREPGTPARPIAENRAVTWAFEPGSIMKAITVSAILDSGTATPDSLREVPAKTDVYGTTFVDDHLHPTQSMSVTEIIRDSSNVGTILWARAMFGNIETAGYHSYLTRFGLGTTTGLGFPGESAGTVGNYANWNGVYPSSTAIGQGATATPMQMLMALNTIANKGKYVAPQYVLGRKNSDGSFVPESPSDSRQVITPETAQQVMTILKSVVDAGTGTAAKIEGFDVGGKTGSAWKPQNDSVSDDHYRDALGVRHLAPAFMGTFPVENPQLSIIVVVDDVTNSDYTGGKVAAPVFSEIGAVAARQLHISPTNEPIPAKGRVRNTPEQPPAKLEAEPVPTTLPVPTTAGKGAATTVATKTAPTTTKAPTTTVRATTTTTTTTRAPTTTAKPATTTTTVKAATTVTKMAANMGLSPPDPNESPDP